MQTKKAKNQKPISLDVHLKYRCPDNDCGQEHWLSLLETQTPNFKVVCSCKTVFIPKIIDSVKVLYKKKHEKHNKPTKTESSDIDTELVKKILPSIMSLGFSKQEAVLMIDRAYKKQPTDDISILIKNTLLETNHG